jgi:hypothetical protein
MNKEIKKIREGSKKFEYEIKEKWREMREKEYADAILNRRCIDIKKMVKTANLSWENHKLIYLATLMGNIKLVRALLEKGETDIFGSCIDDISQFYHETYYIHDCMSVVLEKNYIDIFLLFLSYENIRKKTRRIVFLILSCGSETNKNFFYLTFYLIIPILTLMKKTKKEKPYFMN